MKKNRYIRQFNFNDRLNGYLVFQSNYDTRVNNEWIGLYKWTWYDLRYYIR